MGKLKKFKFDDDFSTYLDIKMWSISVDYALNFDTGIISN